MISNQLVTKYRRVLMSAVVGAAAIAVFVFELPRTTPAIAAGFRVSQSVVGVTPKAPGSLAVMAGDRLLVADSLRNQILERLPTGTFRVFAGSGRRGFSGDGGPATAAALNGPSGMVATANGTVFFADSRNNRVRKIAPDGVITTVAGDGRGFWVPNGTPALAANLLSPQAVTLDAQGRLVIAATGSSEILRLERNGNLTKIAGIKSRAGVSGIGRLATQASADGPNAVAFDARGDLFLVGSNTKTLLMIDTTGRMRIPGGSHATALVRAGFYPRGAGGLVSTGGSVYAIAGQNIVRVDPTGTHPYVSPTTFDAVQPGFIPTGLASAAPGGNLYVDTSGKTGWSPVGSIASVNGPQKIRVIWRN